MPSTPVPRAPVHSVRDFLRRYLRPLLASVALGLGFAWILRAGALPLFPPAGAFDRVAWPRVASMACALLFAMLVRMARFHFLIAPVAKVSFLRVMTISSLTLGLITFLPFRLGEVARPALLRERGKLSGWAVSGTVAAERIIDGVVFSVMLLVGLAIAPPRKPLPSRIGDLPVPAALVPGAAVGAAVLFVSAFAIMALFFWRRETARRLTKRWLGPIAGRHAETVADAVGRVSEGMRFLPSVRHTAPFLGATLVSIAAQIWSLELLAGAIGLPELDFARTAVVFGVLALGFAVPNAPGFFGAFQLSLYAGLAVYVDPGKVVVEGALFVFLAYAVYIVAVVLLSVLGLIGEYLTPRSAPA